MIYQRLLIESLQNVANETDVKRTHCKLLVSFDFLDVMTYLLTAAF